MHRVLGSLGMYDCEKKQVDAYVGFFPSWDVPFEVFFFFLDLNGFTDGCDQCIFFLLCCITCLCF
jgi:hypothetical protein